MTEENPRRRRWFQFRLRTLLILTFLCSLFFAWVGAAFQRATRSRQTIVESQRIMDILIKPGASVKCSCTVEYRGYPTQWLDKLFGYEGERYIVGFRAAGTFNDTDMACLAGLVHLKVLELDGTQITDAGLKYLEGLVELRRLSLCDTQITDVGLGHLKGLNNLNQICLRNTGVTVEGLDTLYDRMRFCDIQSSVVRQTSEK